VYNFFKSTKIIAETIEGDFKQTVKPGGKKKGCHYSNKDCNPTGKSKGVIHIRIKTKGSPYFEAVVQTEGGGWVSVKQKKRDDLNLKASTIYVESYNVSKHLRTRIPWGVNKKERFVRFLVTADPQFEDDFGENEKRSKANKAVMDELVRNRLKNSCKYKKWYASCSVRGIIIPGDLTQHGYLGETKWYKKSLVARRFIYDGWGNHDDQPNPYNWNDYDVFDYLRLKHRTTRATKYWKKSMHYSWDWHDVHFAQLNLFPGNETAPKYDKHDPKNSLKFLKEDLADNVGDTGRPVVLTHHYGFDDFSIGKSKKKEVWWTEKQREKYWNVIKDYNVIAIFTGHWHVGPGAAKKDWHIMWKGINTFNAAATHKGVFLDVGITEDVLQVERWGKKPDEKAKRYAVVEIPLK